MKDVDYRNHVDPSISSGSSPGISESALTTREIHAQDANRSTFPAPHWRGEARPHGVRRVRLQTRFPSLGLLTNLVRNLGYDGSAALAAMVQAHQPWLRSVDRRRANPIDADEQAGAVSTEYTVIHGLYRPAAPSRRTKTGGGLNKKQVHQALARKRWDSPMKKAVFEIVYRRRSTLQVSNSSGIPVEILYAYASRLRHCIRNRDLRGQGKTAQCFQ